VRVWRRSGSSRSSSPSLVNQDIVVDAWRIEAASDSDELGLLSSAYQLGYRAAIIVTDAFILISANHFGWRISYAAMAVLMAIGVCASLIAVEPARVARAVGSRAETPLWSGRGLYDAVIGPFREFFRMYGWLAVLMLAMISFYQLPEFVMGPMANPFYHDLGLSKDAVGAVRGSIGLVATLIGIAAGGVSTLRFGYLRTLIAGVDHQDPRHREFRDARLHRPGPARVRRRHVR
jgi:PAT family beta-lactamase induction signal transducer AmpG